MRRGRTMLHIQSGVRMRTVLRGGWGFLRYGLALAGLAAGVATAGMVSTQPEPAADAVTVRAERGGREIVRLDPATGRTRTIYRARGRIDWHTVQVGPGGRIAFVEGGEAFDAPSRLVVLDAEGATVHRSRAADVREIAWCCGQNQVAVITGPRVEGIGFRPEGVSIADVVTGELRRVDGIPGARRLRWVPAHGALYAGVAAPDGEPRVYRYDPAAGHASATPHHAVDFSSDGRYYVEASPEVAGFRVFCTRDGAEVTSRLRLPPEVGPYDRPVWSADADHVLVFSRVTYPRTQPDGAGPGAVAVTPEMEAAARGRIWAVDAESGAVVRSMDGWVDSAWRTGAAALPVTRGRRVELLRPVGQRERR